MKKIAVLLLSALLAAPAAYADAVLAENEEVAEDSIYTQEAAQPVTYKISLNEAINMAYENNPQIEANELEQKGNEVNISAQRLTKRAYKDIPVNVSSNFELYCVKNGYSVDAAEMALRISQKENEKIKSDIAYDVTEAYYNLVLMHKLVNAAENSYNLALDNNKVVEASYNLGLIPQLEYENAAVTVVSCANALTSYRLNCKTAEENLKILINKDAENCTVIPTDEIECDEYSSNLESDIASAMESRFDLNSLKEKRDLSKRYFELSNVTTESSATYNTAYASYMKDDYNYTHTQKLIALSIRGAYNSVVTSKASMDTTRMKYEIDLKQYDSAKLKYDLGMISNIELTKAINDLYDSQVAYAQAKLNYRLAVEKYKYEITIGL